MSSPCFGVSPGDIPILDRQTNSFESVSLCSAAKDENDEAPPVLIRASDIRSSQAEAARQPSANGSLGGPIFLPKTQEKPSFMLQALIKRPPSPNAPAPAVVRKRRPFRIDDILARVWAGKEQQVGNANESPPRGDAAPLTITSFVEEKHNDVCAVDIHAEDKLEEVHSLSSLDIGSSSAESAQGFGSNTTRLLMPAEQPCPSQLCSKTAEEFGKQQKVDFNDSNVLASLETTVNRPSTPLTPSLDPELLRRLEEEDTPKRALRASTLAATKTSESKAANAMKRRKRKSSKEQDRSPSKMSRKNSKNTTVRYDTPIEVTICDDPNVVCTPSSSGVSSMSSTSSSASPRVKGKKKRRTKIVSNWKPIGSGSRHYVYMNNDSAPVKRICYKAVQHCREPEKIRVRDSVVVKSLDGTCNFGKVTRIFLDEDTGALMASVFWYYNVDQIEMDHSLIYPPIADRELFASRHLDVVPLDAVEESVFVITFNEFGRYMAENKIDALPRAQRPREENELWPRGELGYPRRSALPCEDTPIELVYFCRRLYDFKQKKITTQKPATSRKLLAARRSAHRSSH